MYPTIRLKAGKEEALQRRHPWIFSGALHPQDPLPAPGTIVTVCNAKGVPVATGMYQAGSIAIKILAFEATPIDLSFWQQKLKEALHLRRQLHLGSNTNAYRLVHGEGDQLPGLIIDLYGSHAVIQPHSAGMYQARTTIAEALKICLGSSLETIYCKSKQTVFDHPGADDEWLLGTAAETIALENNHQFLVNWVKGQKTGFFLDQRDNRDLLARYAQGKDVLNTFCYTGGFSIYAACAQAKSVTSIDISGEACRLTSENLLLNQLDTQNHPVTCADVLPWLAATKNAYDIIVLDPPAFAKNLAKRHNAVQAYKRLNARAMEVIRPGGLLFTFSCSQVVDRELFTKTIHAAAIETGKPVQILHQLSQGADHPVNVFHPEGNYLKGLVLKVQ
jgi:23S rRNA (cytosine1962-C5)-methyltransferase